MNTNLRGSLALPRAVQIESPSKRYPEVLVYLNSLRLLLRYMAISNLIHIIYAILFWETNCTYYVK